jgi:hypothetical protein
MSNFTTTNSLQLLRNICIYLLMWAIFFISNTIWAFERIPKFTHVPCVLNTYSKRYNFIFLVLYQTFYHCFEMMQYCNFRILRSLSDFKVLWFKLLFYLKGLVPDLNFKRFLRLIRCFESLLLSEVLFTKVGIQVNDSFWGQNVFTQNLLAWKPLLQIDLQIQILSIITDK